jgi:hypothetical protein
MVRQFTATLHKSPDKGGWTYVVWPASTTYVGARGRVRVHGTIDGLAFRTSFSTPSGGWHKLPVKADVRKAIGKQDGDDVIIRLEQRFEG